MHTEDDPRELLARALAEVLDFPFTVTLAPSQLYPGVRCAAINFFNHTITRDELTLIHRAYVLVTPADVPCLACWLPWVSSGTYERRSLRRSADCTHEGLCAGPLPGE